MILAALGPGDAKPFVSREVDDVAQHAIATKTNISSPESYRRHHHDACPASVDERGQSAGCCSSAYADNAMGVRI
jgi:hypothetical protein